ncbi:hypothetical protein M6B38_120710 [Iris pallida]|uniref:Uncharacterized protein n=1 Tax=Iris pallida TaxID=29817 RepID=A0AAX6H995_IRIPA|nr:hypothetical protein M6B38_120710 [Iris pallida]
MSSALRFLPRRAANAFYSGDSFNDESRIGDDLWIFIIVEPAVQTSLRSIAQPIITVGLIDISDLELWIFG